MDNVVEKFGFVQFVLFETIYKQLTVLHCFFNQANRVDSPKTTSNCA